MFKLPIIIFLSLNLNYMLTIKIKKKSKTIMIKRNASALCKEWCMELCSLLRELGCPYKVLTEGLVSERFSTQ